MKRCPQGRFGGSGQNRSGLGLPNFLRLCDENLANLGKIKFEGFLKFHKFRRTLHRSSFHCDIRSFNHVAGVAVEIVPRIF